MTREWLVSASLAFGEPDFGLQRSRLLHGSSGNPISILLSAEKTRSKARVSTAARKSNSDSHSKKWNRSAEAGDETGEAKGHQASGTNTSRNAKTDSPAEAIEGVVKRIDLLGSEKVARFFPREPREQRARVQLVR